MEPLPSPGRPSEDLGLYLKCTRKPQKGVRPLYGGPDLVKNLAVVDCPRPSPRHGCSHLRALCPATLVATIPHQALFCVSPHLATLCICPPLPPSTRPQEQGAGKMGLTLRHLQELPPGPRMSARPGKGHQGPVCSLLYGERLIHEALMLPAQCPAQSRHSGMTH